MRCTCSAELHSRSLHWLTPRARLARSGPREDATRIGSAGVIRRQAVDISPLRRVNQAIYLLTTGARESAFRNIKTVSECLADELINAAKGSSNSCARLPGHSCKQAAHVHVRIAGAACQP